jgi:hypothetical protein
MKAPYQTLNGHPADTTPNSAPLVSVFALMGYADEDLEFAFKERKIDR